MFLYIETREMKEKTIQNLTSLVKTKEDKFTATPISPMFSLFT